MSDELITRERRGHLFLIGINRPQKRNAFTAQMLERAIALATTVAEQAPLGVRATIANARLWAEQGEAVATTALDTEIRKLMGTEDAREGMMSFMQRRAATFRGR